MSLAAWLGIAVGLTVFACHEPVKLVQPTASTVQSSASNASGVQVFPINVTKQICNPAISIDTVHFPASMLWLGFSGDLSVNNPPAGYTTTNARQHDRLTISGYDNSVKWFILKDNIPGVACEFQDPDWTAHPDWIVTMGAHPDNGNCDNGNLLYSGWVIRPRDNARFKFSDNGLDEISTPNAWLADVMTDSAKQVDSASYDAQGLATKASVQAFFGTDQVKFTWSKEESGYAIHYVDYSEATPVDRTLPRPAGRETWKAESGMVSPDGKWIAFNLFDRQDAYEAWVQELRPGARPMLVDSGAMDPRWWVHPVDPSRVYLVYATVPAGNGYIVKQDLQSAALLASGAAGATWLQEVRLYAGLPADLSFEKVGSARLLLNLPFRAGLSPDGHWLGTGTNDGYMAELP